MDLLPSVSALAESFAKLPGVGPKTAERMAYAVLGMDEEDAKKFSEVLLEVKRNIHVCPRCGLFAEGEGCEICDAQDRDRSTIMVVSSFKDALAIEKSGSYKGLYHSLNGTLAPSKGVYPEDLNVDSLLERLGGVSEVVIATNPNIEGETTALYVAKRIGDRKGLKVTRLAYGLSMGSSLEYSDAVTLGKAIEGRKGI